MDGTLGKPAPWDLRPQMRDALGRQHVRLLDHPTDLSEKMPSLGKDVPAALPE